MCIRDRALKPFPQYNTIANPWLDIGNSTYNSLQVSVNHRVSQGLTFMLNYTFSKELDDLAGMRHPDNRHLEKGLGVIHHANVASATFVYQFPFGAGHKLKSDFKPLDLMISHWQVSGIFTYGLSLIHISEPT